MQCKTESMKRRFSAVSGSTTVVDVHRTFYCTRWLVRNAMFVKLRDWINAMWDWINEDKLYLPRQLFTMLTQTKKKKENDKIPAFCVLVSPVSSILQKACVYISDASDWLVRAGKARGRKARWKDIPDSIGSLVFCRCSRHRKKHIFLQKRYRKFLRKWMFCTWDMSSFMYASFHNALFYAHGKARYAPADYCLLKNIFGADVLNVFWSSSDGSISSQREKRLFHVGIVSVSSLTSSTTLILK